MPDLREDWKEEVTREGASPNERIRRDGGSSSRLFIGPWNDRLEFMKEAVGYTTVDGDPKIRRVTPYYHPEKSDHVCIEAEVVQGKGWEQKKTEDDLGELTQPVNEWRWAVVRLHYEAVEYNTTEDSDLDSLLGGDEAWRFTRLRGQSQGDYLSLPGHTLHWASNAPNPGLVIPYGVGVIVGYREVEIDWLQIPLEYWPITRIQDMLGKVNSDTYDFQDGRFSAAAGTLLFEPPAERYYVQADGTLAGDLTYKLKYFSKGHNNLFYADTTGNSSGWYQANRKLAGAATLYTAGSIPDGRCIYDEISFTDNLFKIEGQA